MAGLNSIIAAGERQLLRQLEASNAAAVVSTMRLARHQRVLAPADDPSAFVTLARFQADLNVVGATMNNVTAAGSLLSQTQSVLSEIRVQVQTIHDQLATDEDRTLTPDQRAAAQSVIDDAVQRIQTLAGSTIDGRRTLDGSADYTVSGRNSAQVRWMHVYDAGGAAGTPPTLSGRVLTPGTQAALLYTGSGGKTTAAATFSLAGSLGATTITVANDESLASVATKVNNVSHKTGVTASVDGSKLTLQSVDYGTQATAAVSVSSGTFAVTGGHGDGTANGTNAVAEINGHLLPGDTSAAVQGNRFNVDQNGFHYELEFAGGFSGQFDTMTVVGGPLVLALSTDVSNRSKLAVPAVFPSMLGGLSGTLDQVASGGNCAGLDGNTSRALRIVEETFGQLDRVGGIVDGFYNASVRSSSSLLAALQTKLRDAAAQTDGFNAEAEEENLAYQTQLAANATAGLAILNQQRQALVDLIKNIAGLD